MLDTQTEVELASSMVGQECQLNFQTGWNLLVTWSSHLKTRIIFHRHQLPSLPKSKTASTGLEIL